MKVGLTFILVLSFALISCGTDTGNPQTPAPNAAIGEHPHLNYTENLRHEICQLLSNCLDQVTYSLCSEQFGSLPNLHESLGLSSDFENYNEIIFAEKNKSLQPQSQPANLCLYNIKALSCDNVLVRNSYDEHHPIHPFFPVEKLLAPICQESFDDQ